MTDSLIQISHLTVQSGQRILLQDVSLEIYPQEITLLVGGSGAGKTVFMKILTGLINPTTPNFQISGSITIEGREIINLQRMPWQQNHTIGIVFQDYGLFDTYSVRQNLDFAFAHSAFKMKSQERDHLWLRLQNKLDLDPDLLLRYASGGQKRRVAIARTLAYNPDIVIYDEPTTGLDPQMARRVAQLIYHTHEVFHKKSSIVVTHLYEDFLTQSNRIIFLDPDEKTLREVSANELEQLIHRGRLQTSAPHSSPQKFFKRLLLQGERFLENTASWSVRIVAFIIMALLRLLPYWRSPVWGMRFFLHYLRLVTFVNALLYIGIAAVIIGFVGAYFTFKFLPYGHYTRPLITEDVLAALGYGYYRIIIPIMISVLVAARCGAAVTSDVGNRVYLQEVDAMRSLGASPQAYLQTNINYAFLLGMPLLTIFAFFLARATCLVVFLVMHPHYNAVFADAVFHNFLRSGNSLLKGTQWVVAKQIICGFGIANICYAIGIRPKSYTTDISRDITLTVICTTLFVLLTHLIFALIEF